jgi:hypothetical protein
MPSKSRDSQIEIKKKPGDEDTHLVLVLVQRHGHPPLEVPRDAARLQPVPDPRRGGRDAVGAPLPDLRRLVDVLLQLGLQLGEIEKEVLGGADAGRGLADLRGRLGWYKIDQSVPGYDSSKVVLSEVGFRLGHTRGARQMRCGLCFAKPEERASDALESIGC